MKKLAFAFAALSLVAVPAAVEAAPCKDAKGKFIKCPPAAAKPAAKSAGAKKVCRNAKGHFTKC